MSLQAPPSWTDPYPQNYIVCLSTGLFYSQGSPKPGKPESPPPPSQPHTGEFWYLYLRRALGTPLCFPHCEWAPRFALVRIPNCNSPTRHPYSHSQAGVSPATQIFLARGEGSGCPSRQNLRAVYSASSKFVTSPSPI